MHTTALEVKSVVAYHSHAYISLSAHSVAYTVGQWKHELAMFQYSI